LPRSPLLGLHFDNHVDDPLDVGHGYPSSSNTELRVQVIGRSVPAELQFALEFRMPGLA
jgi:hypothetical protein